MQPTEKSPQIDEFLKAITGRDRTQSIKENKCNLCGGEAISFRDVLSTREYAISGMCQRCQDDIFGV